MFLFIKPMGKELGTELRLAVAYSCSKVERALLDHDCKPALQWCEDHSSKLRKLESTLPFQVCSSPVLALLTLS